jgi:predicted regulator of Ras-like GTPase activity (Roadblock/LC7/MglB family)
LQAEFETDDVLDAKAVVARISSMPGIKACAIVFSDGLSLAGNLPAEYEVDALCALAPAILKKIGEQMVAAKLGALNGITLFCANAAVTFFAHRNICLAALHSAGEEIGDEVRTRLTRVAEELAGAYLQSA